LESTNLHEKFPVLTEFAVSEICDERRFTQSRKKGRKLGALGGFARENQINHKGQQNQKNS